MTDQHPMSPSSEQLQQWATECWGSLGELIGEEEKYIAIAAYRAGADDELEACCEWLKAKEWIHSICPEFRDELRAARRPKPPSLKEQALGELDSLENMGACNADIIRRALEQLDD